MWVRHKALSIDLITCKCSGLKLHLPTLLDQVHHAAMVSVLTVHYLGMSHCQRAAQSLLPNGWSLRKGVLITISCSNTGHDLQRGRHSHCAFILQHSRKRTADWLMWNGQQSQQSLRNMTQQVKQSRIFPHPTKRARLPAPFLKQDNPVGVCPSTSPIWYGTCDPGALAINKRPGSQRALRCMAGVYETKSCSPRKALFFSLAAMQFVPPKVLYQNSGISSQSRSHLEKFRGCSRGCACVRACVRVCVCVSLFSKPACGAALT